MSNHVLNPRTFSPKKRYEKISIQTISTAEKIANEPQDHAKDDISEFQLTEKRTASKDKRTRAQQLSFWSLKNKSKLKERISSFLSLLKEVEGKLMRNIAMRKQEISKKILVKIKEKEKKGDQHHHRSKTSSEEWTFGMVGNILKGDEDLLIFQTILKQLRELKEEVRKLKKSLQLKSEGVTEEDLAYFSSHLDSLEKYNCQILQIINSFPMNNNNKK